MAQLIRIGNSQGIRIPKPLIEQAKLEGMELSIELVAGGGLLVRPIEKARAKWDKQIKDILKKNGEEPLDHDWLDAPLTSEDWVWE